MGPLLRPEHRVTTAEGFRSAFDSGKLAADGFQRSSPVIDINTCGLLQQLSPFRERMK